MSYHVDIHQAALENSDFRRVLFTTPMSQLVLMTVQPGEDIGLETHHDHDQILVFVAGRAEAQLGQHRSQIKPGDAVVVPAGTLHNFVNVGLEPLKLYTIYTPPEHAYGTVHHTRAEAMVAEALEHDEAAAPAAVEEARSAGPGTTVGSLIGPRSSD